MTEAYFTLKVVGFWFLIGLFLIVLLTTISIVAVSELRWKRKVSLLISNGFERYLHDVAAFGDGAFYGWRRNDMRILESEMKNMSYKALKGRIEVVNNNET